MINAYEARRQTKKAILMKPTFENINAEIHKAILKGYYEAAIKIRLGDLNEICEILEGLGYVCTPNRRDDAKIIPDGEVYITVNWRGDDKNEQK